MRLRIKYLREARGLTQEELASKMGVTHAAVQRWESGKREVGSKKLMVLADIFRCHPGELFDPPPPEMTEAQLRAADIARRLGPDDLHSWLTIGIALGKPREVIGP